ncbi:MAG: hypothetical protein ACAI25_04625 [Planctomycetota bacterium]
MASFTRFLDITLKLKIDGVETTVPNGQVESIQVDLHPWGFDAEASFWLSSQRTDDTLFAKFSGKKLIEVSLKAGPSMTTGSPAPANQTIDLKGLVRSKEVREETIRAESSLPVKFRRYTIRFSDVARVLWKQHRPNDLFVDQKLQDVIDAHKGAKITIACADWASTQTVHPIHFLGLGADPRGASFYDFLVWYVDTQNGVLSYDPVANSYKLVATKPETGTPGKLQPIEITAWRTEFPETPRQKVNVQNSFATTPTTTAVANAEEVAGLRRDDLVRTSIASVASDRVTLETARLVLREPEVVVDFAAWPTTGFLPWALLDFSHADFGTSIFQASKVYRSRSVRFTATNPVDAVRSESSTNKQGTTVSLSVRLELKTEKHVPLPDYVTPTWPVEIEGIVVSEQGAEKEETYQFYTDQNTSVEQYKVKIPLWAAKIIVAPYEPLNFTSHFYFPLIKDERVLTLLSFRSARVHRTLDWRPGAKLPMDGQGDHVVLGKHGENADDQTTISHAYVDAKPVLTVKRVKVKDTEVLVMEEGKILLRTKEEQ